MQASLWLHSHPDDFGLLASLRDLVHMTSVRSSIGSLEPLSGTLLIVQLLISILSTLEAVDSVHTRTMHLLTTIHALGCRDPTVFNTCMSRISSKNTRKIPHSGRGSLHNPQEIRLDPMCIIKHAQEGRTRVNHFLPWLPFPGEQIRASVSVNSHQRLAAAAYGRYPTASYHLDIGQVTELYIPESSSC